MEGKGGYAKSVMPPAQSAPTLRSLVPAAFLPCMVYEIANGAIAPVIALTALNLGASAGIAGFMLALLGIGQLLGDLPAASLAERVGDRRAMILAAGVATLALVGCLLAPSLFVLGAALLVFGVCTAVFYLARQSYMTEVVPVDLRARAMSTLGGAHRVGLFIGPFIGAAAIGVAGLRASYVVAIAATTSTAIVLLIVADLTETGGRSQTHQGRLRAREVLAAHRRLLVTLGVAVLGVGMVRAARQTVLPLWADHTGLNAAQTSLIFGIASAADIALFYPSGKIMDSFGRLAVAIPAMLIMGLSMTALPLTVGAVSLTAVAIVMSLGNGIGSGIMMTLGADVAPAGGRTRFLSMWRMMGDTGSAIGPVLVSVGALLWTLAAGIVLIGIVGVGTAATLAIWVPKYSAYATPRSVRAARLRLAAEQAGGTGHATDSA